MNRVIPQSVGGRVAFALTHADLWSADPEAVGLTEPEVLAVRAQAETVRDLIDESTTTRAAAKTVTAAKVQADKQLARLLSSAVSNVKVKAQRANRPAAILAAAAIPVPSMRRRPWGRPGPPHSLTAQPHPDGSITLRWKRPSRQNGTNGHGGKVCYQIDRRIEPPNSSSTGSPTNQRRPIWKEYDTTPFRTFRDRAVPTGITSVSYRIIALRNGEASTAAQTVVYYGRS